VGKKLYTSEPKKIDGGRKGGMSKGGPSQQQRQNEQVEDGSGPKIVWHHGETAPIRQMVNEQSRKTLSQKRGDHKKGGRKKEKSLPFQRRRHKREESFFQINRSWGKYRQNIKWWGAGREGKAE